MIEILIPHYGDEDLLREAVSSVLTQSDPRWHLHILDDSPTGSVGSWASNLPAEQVVYEANPIRLGVAANLQRCMGRARAEWVVFLGCDDVLQPHFVARIHLLAKAFPQVSVILPGVEIIDHAGVTCLPVIDRVKRLLSPVGTSPGVLSGEALLASLMRGNWTYFPAMAWRRRTITEIGFRQDLATTLDLALLAEVILDGGQLLVDPKAAFCYRRHPASASSVTAANSERFLEEQRLFEELASKSRAIGWGRADRAARWHLTSRLHAMTLIPRALRRRDGAMTRTLVRYAFWS
jgi:glycosyltransferase involved in cell wall biosynthesis